MYAQYIYTDTLDNVIIIEYYEALRDRLNSIIYYLQKAINELESFNNDLFDYYSIDNLKVNNVNILDIKEKLTDRVKYLNDTVIQFINEKINILQQDLSI